MDKNLEMLFLDTGLFENSYKMLIKSHISWKSFALMKLDDLTKLILTHILNSQSYDQKRLTSDHQETPGVIGKFGLGIRNEAGQRLIEFCQKKCTGHSKHPLPTTQEKTLHMDITRWSTPKSD